MPVAMLVPLLLFGCGGGRGETTAGQSTATTDAPAAASAKCPGSQTLEARAKGRPTTRATTNSTELAAVRIDPPPAGATPGVTASQAFDAAMQTTGHPDPGPRPTVTLALVTTSTVNKKLSWVVVLADASVVRISGGPAPAPGETKPPPPPCYIGSQVIPVDAVSGSVLVARQLDGTTRAPV